MKRTLAIFLLSSFVLWKPTTSRADFLPLDEDLSRNNFVNTLALLEEKNISEEELPISLGYRWDGDMLRIHHDDVRFSGDCPELTIHQYYLMANLALDALKALSADFQDLQNNDVIQKSMKQIAIIEGYISNLEGEVAYFRRLDIELP